MVTLTNCTISSNTATSYGGGGICNIGSNNSGSGAIALTKCTVSGNTATDGGGIYNENGDFGSITLTNCLVTANAATDAGGGVYDANAPPNTGTSTPITLTNCTITANTATDGGGIFNVNYSNGTITLTNCTVSGNSAADGGGIYNYNYSGGTITLTNCTFSNNSARAGAGIEEYGDVTIVNSAFIGNVSGSFGGGLEASRGASQITNCTFFANMSGIGGDAISAIFDSGTPSGSATVRNCILWDLTGSEEIAESGMGVSVDHSDVYRNSIEAGPGNINKDPLFVNAATGDLHLKPGSPCLGAGTPTGAPPTDLDGNPRPNPPSIGAYELTALPATITGFSLTPNQITAPGPVVTANVSVTGNFTKVTVSPAPGSLGSASPTFNLMTNSGGGWGGSFPTAFLKLAKTNPVTFIATGTRTDGTTASMTAALQVGALPSLAFSLSADKPSVHRGETFTLHGYVGNSAATPAQSAIVNITLPTGINYLTASGFTYDTTSRTLSLKMPLLATKNGFVSFDVSLQADANALKQTPLVMAATLTCSGFQTELQNPSVTIASGLLLAGVDVNATGGYGLLDGTAQVHEDLGTQPLYATLTPVSSLHHIWLGVDYVDVANGAAAASSSADGVGSALGQLGLLAPDASPTYDATFPSIGSSVSIGVRLNNSAAVMNIANIFLQAASAVAKYGPPPTTKDILDTYDLIQNVKAFHQSVQDLQGPFSNPLQQTIAIAAAIKALTDMDDKDTQTISLIVLKLFGKDVKASQLRRFFKVLGRGETIFDLLHVLADETTLVIQTGGDDMVVTFTGSPLRSISNSSTNQTAKQARKAKL